MTRFLTTILLTFALAATAFAERTAPPSVTPVFAGPLRIEAPNTDGRVARIEAFDRFGGQRVWSAVVFESKIDPSIEEDAQWHFIRSLRVVGDFVEVTADDGTRYWVSLTKRKTEEIVQLPPFVDTAYSQVFTVSRAQPLSDDRRYRLKSVRNDGSVELIDCAAAEIATKTIVVSPAHRVKRGERPQTIVVVAADADKQTATIRELRMK